MVTRLLRRAAVVFLFYGFALGCGAGAVAAAQGLGSAGTLQGTVTDPTGAVVPGATVELKNPVSQFDQTQVTDDKGQFAFRNLGPNPYHLTVALMGFETVVRDVTVRTGVPVTANIQLALAGTSTTIEVVGKSDIIETSPTAHTDLDQALLAKLPLETSSSGLNAMITLASPGVVADSNGFFHPLGDHAQTQFSVDNQPVTDQQSRIYSNQISPDAVQSMEVITGVPPAEFGDKDSLVVRVITKSGLGQAKPAGGVTASYGSFSSPSGDVTLGAGSSHLGNFLSASGLLTDRFLDSPEFEALHDRGNQESLFDRLDWQHDSRGTVHLNVQLARSAFLVPNTYDQQGAGQDQRQTINSFNLAPGYSRALTDAWLLTANAYMRQDHITYSPSMNPFADQPATIGQDRSLTNVGAKVDASYVSGRHTVKFGTQLNATKLDEHFTLGITDPTFNDPANTDSFLPGLAPYDLTRGGSLFRFDGGTTIKTQGFYAQDAIAFNAVTVNLGLRADRYDGLGVTQSAIEPRAGLSYQIKPTGTVFRASYGRTMETPYNENLVLSSSTGSGGLSTAFGGFGVQPLTPGRRDQTEIGIQQAISNWVSIDVGYFYKLTTNAFDFDVLLNTPIAFPIEWRKSQLDGLSSRVTLVEHGGFTAYTVLGHTTARFFGPENGGLIFNSPLSTGVFRIDHDEKLEQTTNVQYQFLKSLGAWAALTWRYDSGLVAGFVPDFATALTLNADEQAAIGLYCGGTFATPSTPITSCSSSTRGATRIVIPPDGTENNDTNPPRIAPRHLFDLGLGVDNLLRTGRQKVKVRFSVINLTNREALYNFLSTFSGTHFVTPRTYQVQLGWTF
jgi:hypothetical protein